MPIISAWAILFCGLLFLGLTWQVIGARRASGVSLGDGGDELLLRRMRGQGNAAEQMPMTLLALVAAELIGGSTFVLGLFAVIFCAGRGAHGFGFGWLERSVPLRMFGMLASISGSALILLYLLYALLTLA